MRRKKICIVFDIITLVLVAAAVFALIYFASPNKETKTVTFTIVTKADTSKLSAGDVLVLTNGGKVGVVTGKGNGYIEVTAEAEEHAGGYYSGSVPLTDNRSYEICVGADRYDGVIHRISVR